MPTLQNNFRVRKSFAKINKVIEIPNLINIQKQSYEKFLQADVLPEKREDVGLRGAQAAHHRATVEMALQEAARGKRDRHRGEHHAQQCGEVEIFLRPLQGRLHFRAGVPYAFEALPRSELRQHPRTIAIDLRLGA